MLDFLTLIFYVIITTTGGPVDRGTCYNHSPCPRTVQRHEITMYSEDACIDAMARLNAEDIAAKDHPMFCINNNTGDVIRFVIPD